jgi:hypothetical protein
MRRQFHEHKHTSLTFIVVTVYELRFYRILRSSHVGTEKTPCSKKGRFGGAPVLDVEYDAPLHPKRCDEHSGAGAWEGSVHLATSGQVASFSK